MSNSKLSDDVYRDVAGDLIIERTSFAAGENRPTGARSKFKLSPFDRSSLVPVVGGKDDKEIIDIIEKYTRAESKEYIKLIGDVTTTPFFFVGQDQISEIDKAAAKDFFKSQDYQDGLKAYPVYSPRKINLSSYQITYMGQRKATVTFALEEAHSNGIITRGNCSAILMKEDSGWKIGVYAYHDVPPLTP